MCAIERRSLPAGAEDAAGSRSAESRGLKVAAGGPAGGLPPAVSDVRRRRRAVVAEPGRLCSTGQRRGAKLLGVDRLAIVPGFAAAAGGPQKGPNMRRSPWGFTIVELLVVLAILTLLMAILLPAIGKARDLGRSTVCKSNLRQIGVGLTAWGSDFKKYPLKQDNLAGSTDFARYYEAKRDDRTEVALSKRQYVDWWRDHSQRPGPGQIACPVGSAMKAGTLWRVQYNINLHMVYSGGATDQISNFQRTIQQFLSQVNPANRVMCWDGVNTWNHNSTYWDHTCADGTDSHLGTNATTLYNENPRAFMRIMRIHLNGTNMLFADGHSAWIADQGEDLPYYRAYEEPNNGTFIFDNGPPSGGNDG
jgi:prepilin-type processing-associated H-X9-DG protein